MGTVKGLRTAAPRGPVPRCLLNMMQQWAAVSDTQCIEACSRT